MAVVAGIFAFACTTDTTEDLGVQVSNGANGENGTLVELSLSLEESRTQLGEKVDGLYPLYWSEGDKISVNGVESGEAVINAENPASAVFAVTEAETYSVAYPAAPAGKVLFAAKQNHVVEGNTFASGVSTMYGYGEDRGNIKLNHLTGVLKIGIKGEAILSKAQISTVDRAPIAGTFDIDFETGKLTSGTASKEVIEYSFGENGLQLTDSEQYIHVAVPAGKYDELYITLYEKGNAGNVMYATVKAGESKPLTAGNVREFSNSIIYAPNAQVFVISSAEQLVAFKAAVEATTTLTMDAVFTEDIDMTGVEWTPIAGAKYVNTVHGNGYAIKGLTAPLFNQTSASIKGLHLVDVNLETNITDAANRFFGALVCAHKPASSDIKVVVENCSVSGTMVLNNPDYPTNQNLFIGGVVGATYSGTIDGCVSHVNFTAQKLAVDGASKSVAVGGVVGLASNWSTAYSTINNSKYDGVLNIQLDGTITTAYLGGVVAYSQNTNLGLNMSNCENSGAITYKGTATTLYIGGVLGESIGDKSASLDNLYNSGAVTVKSGSTIGNVYMGGVAGDSKSCNLDTAVNDGTVIVESGAKFKGAQVGGIIGLGTKESDTFTIKNLTNNGSIEFGGDCVDAATATTLRLGGIVGYSQATIITATNNGNITVSGDLTPNVATPATFKEAKGICIAGIVGYKTTAYINNLTNTGNITVSSNMNSLVADVTDEKGNTVKQYAQVNIGGLVAYTSNNANASDETAYSSVSSGDITVSGNTTNCTLCIGGSFGHHYAASGQNNETCSSDIKVSGTHTGNVYVGGIISAAIYGGDNLTFNGSIEIVEGTQIGGQCHVGGCISSITSTATKEADVPVGKNLTNNGTIKVGATTVVGIIPNIAGCVGYSDHTTEAAGAAFAAPLSNLTNTGAVTYTGVAAQGNVFIGGCVGRCRGALTTANNSGTITYAGNTSNTEKKIAYVAGVAAAMNNCADDVHNSGEVKCVNGAQYYELGLGGVFANVSGLGSTQKYENCSNSGKLSNEAQASETASLGTLKIAGVGGTNANALCKNCHNSGTIVNNGHATTLYMCGVAHDAGRTVTDCYNTGAITMNGTANTAYLCGLACTSDDAITGCYNEGVLSMPQGSAGAMLLCGLVYEATKGSFTNCYNGEKDNTTKGAIKYSSTTSQGSVSIAGTVSTCRADMTNVVNYAPLTIGGKTGNSVYAGGISRIIGAGKTFTECVNYGDITISAVVADESIEGSAEGADAFVGGLVDATSTGEAACTFIRCQNHGDITFTEACKVASACRAGGLGARFEYEAPVVVEDCWNSGNFTFNGKSSVRSAGLFYLSSGIASISAGTFSVKGSLINTGNLSVNADASSTGDLPMAGVIAYISKGIALVEGETEALIANTGNVTINTKNTAGKRAFFGGILGYLKTGAIDEHIKFINTGNITVTGEMTNCYVAGIGGACLKPIGYAESYCTISALGSIKETGEYEGYKGVGMFSGPKYQNGTYDIKDGAVGGTIICNTIEDNDPSGDVIYKPNPQTITAENCKEYAYGTVTTDEIAARYTILTEAPVVTLPAKLPVTE